MSNNNNINENNKKINNKKVTNPLNVIIKPFNKLRP